MNSQTVRSKQHIVSSFIKAMRADLLSKEKIVASARRARDGCVSESAIQQSSSLLQDRERSLREDVAALKHLEALQEDSGQGISDLVKIGSIVHICDVDTGEERYFLVVRKGGGNTVRHEGQKIMSISISCPLARVIWGKREGDEAQFGDKTIEILKIE